MQEIASDLGEEAIRKLGSIAAQAASTGKFTLSSGQTSDFYFDGRQVTMNPDAIPIIVKAISCAIRRAQFGALRRLSPKDLTAIGGPATAAIPIASAFLAATSLLQVLVRSSMSAVGEFEDPYECPAGALNLRKAFYVRSEPKDHGSGRLIEGPPILYTDRVILVDDTLTTGTSLLKAAKTVKDVGAKIELVFVLLDREEGGVDRLIQELGVPVYAALTKSYLRDFLNGDR